MQYMYIVKNIEQLRRLPTENVTMNCMMLCVTVPYKIGGNNSDDYY